MNPLPPQAYTKDTLLKAYQWLLTQDRSIKDIATSPDILVSLYLKALRDGESALERPSIQNFKNELKNLAGIMGELDKNQSQPTKDAAPSTPIENKAIAATPVSAPAPAPSVPAAAESPAQPALSQVTQALGNPAPTPAVVEKEAPRTRSSVLTQLLDSHSLQLLAEIKAEFNLSSEIEAMRMLIKIGHKRAQELLK